MASQFQTIASKIAKLEGKKKQVSIGNIREVLSCLVELDAKHCFEDRKDDTAPITVLGRLADKRVQQLIKRSKS